MTEYYQESVVKNDVVLKTEHVDDIDNILSHVITVSPTITTNEDQIEVKIEPTELLFESKPFSCDVCSKLFCTRAILLTHKKTHEKNKCDICSKSFCRKSNLLKHRMNHSDEKNKHKCDICLKLFLTRANLLRHKMTHTDDKNYKCDVCSKLFYRKDSLQMHKMIHTDEKNHKCDVCSKLFRTNYHLLRHKETHKDEKNHKCDFCSKMFRTRHCLLQHKKVHLDGKNHKCDGCSKLFSTKMYLWKHKKTHTNEKSYKCGVCLKLFSKKDPLLVHQMMHIDERKHKFDICSKLLRTKTHLLSHKIVHKRQRFKENKMKTFWCFMCGRDFSYKKDLTCHLQAHGNLKCNICTEVCVSKEALNNHYKIHLEKEKLLSFNSCSESLSEEPILQSRSIQHSQREMDVTSQLYDKQLYLGETKNEREEDSIVKSDVVLKMEHIDIVPVFYIMKKPMKYLKQEAE